MITTATIAMMMTSGTMGNGGGVGVGTGVGVTGGGAVGVATGVGDSVGTALSAKSTKIEKWSTLAQALLPTTVVSSGLYTPASKTNIFGVFPGGMSAGSKVMHTATGGRNVAPAGPSSTA